MQGLFFRLFSHLLPDALALRIRRGTDAWAIGDGSAIGDPGLLVGGKPGGRTIDRLFWALTQPFAAAREFVDSVYLDLFPGTTREIDKWETHFGLLPALSESDRRANIDAAWKATGGQGKEYLESIFQAAGFDVYLHQWWEEPTPGLSGLKNPALVTEIPTIGTTQCGEALSLCGEKDAKCNRFLANEPGYLVNGIVDGQAPPPVPTDDATWPHFLYIGPQTLTSATNPVRAQIPAARRQEFERLMLKLCPAQEWLVTLVDYV